MITQKGRTLVFLGTVPKRLSISPYFFLEFTPDPKQQIWEEKFDQHVLRLSSRIADIAKKLDNLNQTSLDRKSSIGQDDGADVNVSPSVSLKKINTEQTEARVPDMKYWNDIRKFGYFSPPWQRRMEISRQHSRSLYYSFPMSCVESTPCEGPLRSAVSDYGSYPGGNEQARYFCRAPNNCVNYSHSMAPGSIRSPGRIGSAPWCRQSSSDNNRWEVNPECADRVKYSAKKMEERIDENAVVLPETSTLTEDTPSNETKTSSKDFKIEETSTKEDHKDQNKRRKARQFRI